MSQIVYWITYSWPPPPHTAPPHTTPPPPIQPPPHTTPPYSPPYNPPPYIPPLIQHTAPLISMLVHMIYVWISPQCILVANGFALYRSMFNWYNIFNIVMPLSTSYTKQRFNYILQTALIYFSSVLNMLRYQKNYPLAGDYSLNQ